jgi:hypothetical protein
MNNELVEQVITVAESYLGPSAERFILRQITAHLNTTGEEFNASQITELAYWIELSGSLLIEKTKAQELADKVRALE